MTIFTIVSIFKTLHNTNKDELLNSLYSLTNKNNKTSQNCLPHIKLKTVGFPSSLYFLMWFFLSY